MGPLLNMKQASDATWKRRYSIPAVLLLLPFLVFYWFVPFLGHLTIGMDYPMYSIFTQMELQFSLKHGSFPLYVPKHAGGIPASSLTLGQIFHPIPHLAALLPGYWTGKALEWNTLLRLLSLALTHLVLFYFLRRLKLRVDISLILSFITVYNLRMLDMFRYGASLENYTAFLLLCVAIAWYYINSSKYWGPLGIIGAAYLLMCGGHPQMMYYGFLGAGFVTLVLPHFLSEVLPELRDKISKLWKFYLCTIGFCTTGVLMASAYFLPYYYDVVVGTSRRKKPLSWAADYTDTVSGTLNNFFRPFYSDVHGTFWGSSLYLVAGIIPLLSCFKIKIPRIIWFIWGLFILIFLYMQGSRLPFHSFVWEYFPFASVFRIPGRIAMILPFIILLLLAWVMQCEKVRFRFFEKSGAIYPYVLLSCLTLLLFVLYHLVSVPILSDGARYLPAKINKIPPFAESIEFWLGMATLAILIFYNGKQKFLSVPGVLLFVVILFQTVTVLRYGTWVEPKHDTPSLEQMEAQKVSKLTYRGPLGHLRSKSFRKLPLARIYRNYTTTSSNKKAFDTILRQIKKEGVNLGTPLIIHGYSSKKDSNEMKIEKTKGVDQLVLEYSSFNRLRFHIFTHQPGFLFLLYPYSKQWDAYVNSEKTQIYRAAGRYQAVRISEGESIVEFRFWSSPAFWGMVISCVTLSLVSLYFLVNLFSGKLRLFGIFFGLSLGISIFLWWYLSLYSGDNLGTKYVWTSGYQSAIEGVK